jgi:hypothetical protein
MDGGVLAVAQGFRPAIERCGIVDTVFRIRGQSVKQIGLQQAKRRSLPVRFVHEMVNYLNAFSVRSPYILRSCEHQSSGTARVPAQLKPGYDILLCHE